MEAIYALSLPGHPMVPCLVGWAELEMWVYWAGRAVDILEKQRKLEKSFRKASAATPQKYEPIPCGWSAPAGGGAYAQTLDQLPIIKAIHLRGGKVGGFNVVFENVGVKYRRKIEGVLAGKTKSRVMEAKNGD